MAIYERQRAKGVVYEVVQDVGTTLDGRRDRASGTFGTLAEAQEAEARFKAMREATRGRSGRYRLRDYVERVYWPAAAGALAASSMDTYRRELDKRILPALGSMDVRDIDRMAVQRMVDGCSTKDVARKAVSVLKTVLNEAKGDGLISSNPAQARFAMPEPGRKRDNGVIITRFELMEPLFEAIDAVGDECVEKIAVTGLYMGMRPEERYGLDWEDFDGPLRVATVLRAYVTASPAHGGVQLKEPKTPQSKRPVPVPRPARERLLRMERGAGPFITGADGGRISPSTAVKRWRRFLAAAKGAGFAVPEVTVENMRHSFATSYLHAGGNVEDLSRILGHSDINTTYRRYVRPSADDLLRSVDAMFS